MTPWVRVRPGSTVRLKDGYVWQVITVEPASGGQVAATVERPGAGQVTVQVDRHREVEVTSAPTCGPTDEEKRAALLLREALGAEVIECIESGWCSGDDTAGCFCTINCGSEGCVNF